MIARGFCGFVLPFSESWSSFFTLDDKEIQKNGGYHCSASRAFSDLTLSIVAARPGV
jgi:hypothetical protein